MTVHYRSEWLEVKPGNPAKGAPPQFGYGFVAAKDSPYVLEPDGSLRRRSPKSRLSKKERRALRRQNRGDS